jgi:glycosyltransferase involved in cell wall biosynthesis
MMDRQPLVSIDMPVFNGELYIQQALNSLLAQDYENFELIISDNASTSRRIDGKTDIAFELR